MANPVWIGSTNATNAYTATANWIPTTAPTAGDTVWFEAGSGTSLSLGGVDGSDQKATALAALHHNMNFSFNIGSNGTPLKISCSQVFLGEPSMSGTSGSGSGRINLDTDTTSSTIYVYGASSSSTDTGKEPIRLKCNHTSNSIIVDGGLVGIATDSIGDAATLGTLYVTGGTAHVASGSTITTVDISSGQCDVYAGVTTINISAGVLNTRGDLAIGTLTIYGGTVTLNHRKITAGNEITTLNMHNATIDISDSPDAFLVGTLNYWGDCRIIRNAAARDHLTITTWGTQAGTLTLDAA